MLAAEKTQSELVKIYVGYPYFFGTNWCAKCSRCGTVLTKFAFTEDEARQEAESENHRCRR